VGTASCEKVIGGDQDAKAWELPKSLGCFSKRIVVKLQQTLSSRV